MTSTMKKTTADKFSSLFDNNWTQKKSTMRTKHENDRQYDATYSWDARSDNPQSFSRLQATDMPVQNAKPITLSGKQVILLEKEGNPEALIPSGIPKETFIPLTQVQKDLGMSNDLSGKIPVVEEATRQGKAIVLVEPPGFRNMACNPAIFTVVDVPTALKVAGPQTDQKLLNPTQRREILDFEVKQRAANEILGTAQTTRAQVRKQVTGKAFQRGIKGVDSCENESSEIYGERARKEREDREYRDILHLERRGHLAQRASSMLTNGNILVPDSLAPNVRLEKFSQSKGGLVHGLSFEETHNRLFFRSEVPMDPHRRQWLRDMDLGGKQYNITTHAMVEAYPSRAVDRLESRVMGHPSQTSLEGPRNLQGSLRPF